MCPDMEKYLSPIVEWEKNTQKNRLENNMYSMISFM